MEIGRAKRPWFIIFEINAAGNVFKGRLVGGKFLEKPFKMD
jgi:hypothetical protein